jgi:serine/threonine protein kinase
MAGTPPLPPGVVLDGRFEIQSVLGRGGFSIAYIATDLTQNDTCVVKELAPTGSIRSGQALDLSGVPSTNPPRLRRRFLEEASTLAKIEAPGILHLRDAFEEHGTAYYVTDALPGARTLDKILAQDGRMAAEQVQDILYQLMDILDAVHRHKILHRDLKPTNILISPNGEVFLIDFGAAREWHADSAALQTVLFTPGYAPLEQLSDRGRRGPATDIYALCATVYHMLTGEAPRSAAERADGTSILPLNRLRPDLDATFAQAISAGLKLKFQERPQTVAELREMLVVPDTQERAQTGIEAYDTAILRLQRFTYNKNECPVCNGVLERIRPLRAGVCPVCRERSLKKRDLSERQCAVCKTGVLHLRRTKWPLFFCPRCRHGALAFSRKGLLRNKWQAECLECGAVLVGDAQSARFEDQPESEPKTWDQWRADSKRAKEVWICDECEAQFDPQAGGRWAQIDGHGDNVQEYYPDEWARIAVGLKPDAGNLFCEGCGADFWEDGQSIILLSYQADPYGFAARYLEQAIALEDVPWLGAGKTSGNRGLLCYQCDTEFDEDGDFYHLVHSPSVRLTRYADRSLVMQDWHRLAQGLPATGEEHAFLEKLDEVIAEGYVSGEILFEFKNPSILWSGEAKEVEPEEKVGPPVPGDEEVRYRVLSQGNLTVTNLEISYGRVVKKWRAPHEGIVRLSSDENHLFLSVSGESKQRVFELEPAELIVHLKSGDHTVWIGAELVAEKLRSIERIVG